MVVGGGEGGWWKTLWVWTGEVPGTGASALSSLPTAPRDILGSEVHGNVCRLQGAGSRPSSHLPSRGSEWVSSAGLVSPPDPGESSCLSVLGSAPWPLTCPGMCSLQDSPPCAPEPQETRPGQHLLRKSKRDCQPWQSADFGNCKNKNKSGSRGQAGRQGGPGKLRSGGLTLAGPAVGGEHVAAVAGTMEAARLVVANLVAATILLAALVDIWAQRVRGEPSSDAWPALVRRPLYT